MSDLNKAATGSEGQTPAAIDMTKFVPKEDFEKTSAMAKELEAKLDEAKLALVQPEFLEFMESKRAGKVEKKIESSIDRLLDSKDIDKLSPRQILALSIEKAKEAVTSELLPQYQNQIKQMGQTLSDVLAVLELQEVEKKYSDFQEFKDDTKKVLETSTTPLTIEQAYLLAKSSKGSPVVSGKSPAPSEKPIGGTPPGSMQPKKFANKHEAGEDAWNSIVGAGKDYI